MKMTLIMLLIMVSYTTVYAQDTAEVVMVDGKNDAALYSRAKAFVASTFNDAKYATQLMDDNTKTIIVRGLFGVSAMPAYESNVSFALTIISKDGRYRYSFDNLFFNYQAGSLTRRAETNLNEDAPKKVVTEKQWSKVKQQTSDYIAALITVLKKSMDKADENW